MTFRTPAARAMRAGWPVFFLLLVALSFAMAQDPLANQQDYRIGIRQVTGEVVLDGIPDEAFWQEADSATGFWMKSPLVKPGAHPPTVIRLAYDDKFLYMAAWCREIAPVNIQTLRRDANYWRGDGIGIVLDPVNQHTFAYFFAVNPYGSQTDGLILGPNRSVQDDWDGRFFAETHREPGLWTAEMAIPLRSLRFSPGNTEWGVNFVRNVLNQNELHTWAPVPLQFGATDINYTGLLAWDRAPAQETSNIALIPYALGGYQKEPRADKPVQSVLDVGLDARIGLASALNLDLTLNPDFSQAEIDEQPVNLTRFNIRLPERRTFFLENRDVFTNFGTDDIQPFFSRQIGLDESGRTVPILFGARLTGNVAPDTRVGLLNMQTVSVRGQEAQNFSALALHQQVLKRSILRTLITNRQAFADGDFSREDFSRNAGLEAVYLSEDGNTEVWGKYHHAFYREAAGDNGAYAGGAAWRSRRFSASAEASGAGSGFRADLGFVPRLLNRNDSDNTTILLGFHQVQSQLTFSTYPEGKNLFNRHWADFKPQVILNPDGSFNEARQDLSYSFFFRDRRFLQFSSVFQQVDLRFPTRFVRGGEPLPVAPYRFASGSVFFDTDSRRTWYFLSSLGAGQFYNGHLLRAQGGVTYRVQPYGSLGLNASWNRVRLPGTYGEADILNVTTRLDITFTREVFWTTFFQYNSQVQVFNINSRLQWRFAPLSDLFLVYTDSYDAMEFPGLNDRSRTLLLKVNYWLNL